jgi:hypothetical protein
VGRVDVSSIVILSCQQIDCLARGEGEIASGNAAVGATREIDIGCESILGYE